MPLCVGAILSVYTNLPIVIGGTSIEGGFAMCFGALLILLTSQDAMRAAPKIAAAIACAATPTVLNHHRGLDWSDGLHALGGLVGAVLSGLGLYYAVIKQDRAFLCKIILTLATIDVICVGLEIYTPFKAVSDAFRHFAYQGRFIYEGDSRDMSLYGVVRAKAFAQEPSGPARFVAYMLTCAACLSTKRWQMIWTGVLLVVSLKLISSPSLYVAFMVIPMLLVIRLGFRFGINRHAQSALFVVAAICITVASVNVSTLSALLGGKRAEQVAGGTEGSAVQRMLIPPEVVGAAIRAYGPFGTGMGSKTMLQPVITPIFLRYPGGEWMRDGGNTGNYDWGNAWFDVFIYLGPIFGLAFLALLPMIFTNPIPGASLILFQAVTMVAGGLAEPRNWIYYGLIAACFAIHFSDVKLTREKRATPTVRRRVVRPQAA